MTLLLGLTVASACLALGRMASQHEADSLVSVLASLYRWTWFYWAQNRLGLVLALIVSVIHDPLDNLIVQTALNTFVGMSVFAFVGALVGGVGQAATVGLCASALFVAFAPEGYHHDYLLTGQSFGLGMGSSLLAILLFRNMWPRRQWLRLATTFVLFFVSLWANFAVALLAAPWAAMESLTRSSNASDSGPGGARWLRWQWLAVFAPAFASNWLLTRS